MRLALKVKPEDKIINKATFIRIGHESCMLSHVWLASFVTSHQITDQLVTRFQAEVSSTFIKDSYDEHAKSFYPSQGVAAAASGYEA